MSNIKINHNITNKIPSSKYQKIINGGRFPEKSLHVEEERHEKEMAIWPTVKTYLYGGLPNEPKINADQHNVINKM